MTEFAGQLRALREFASPMRPDLRNLMQVKASRPARAYPAGQ
ncbi:MAG: hypothetical protein OEN23_13145 [Paracoccaceae bacterium]|nr:hypothetical protein [Paracoccaceae bacterium]